MRSHRVLLAILLLALFPSALRAQEARSFALGGCGTGLDWGPAALVWNPSTLWYTAPPHGVLTTAGASALDSTNIGGTALDFNALLASQSSSDPVRHHQTYRALAGVQMHAYGMGLLLDQDMSLEASQGAIDFLAAREHGILAASPYDLSLSKSFERVESFALGFARAFPMGQASAAIGGTFKLHQGSRFERTLLSGVFTQGAANNVGMTRWTADSGSGFSWDFGATLKPTSNIQLGCVLENINSNFKWKTQRQNLTLDPSTAAETATAPVVLETVEANRPKATRFAITLVSPAKDSSLTTEMRRFQGKNRWRMGFERVWAPQHLVFRIGSFQEETSNLRVWTGGVGYLGKRVELNLGIQADHWPVVQDSSAFGGAFSVAILL